MQADAAETLEYVPEAQFEHTIADATEYEPALQKPGTTESPVDTQKLPEGQFMHSPIPTET